MVWVGIMFIDEYFQKTGERSNKIADGYYSFQQIADVFRDKKYYIVCK